MPDMTGDDATLPGDVTSDIAGSPSEGLAADPAARLTLGSRVVVRYRIADDPAGQVTDVLGELVARTAEHVVVESTLGRQTVPRRAVVAAKDVPPRASRPGPPHLRVSVDDLAKLTGKGWVAVEQGGLGSWLLRSAPGFTGRANSVLAVGDPTLPLDPAIDYCERWYAERGQKPMFQVSGGPGFRVEDTGLGSALLDRGYVVGGGREDWERVLVLTGRSAGVPPLTTGSLAVVADAKLSADWLMAYGLDHRVVPGVTEAVLTGSDSQLFLSIRDETSGRLDAIARMSMHPGWAGVFGLWVHPDHRRQGLARTVMSAIATVARDHALPAIYLQVSGDNTAAVAFYKDLGFLVHHEYAYLVQPAT